MLGVTAVDLNKTVTATTILTEGLCRDFARSQGSSGSEFASVLAETKGAQAAAVTNLLLVELCIAARTFVHRSFRVDGVGRERGSGISTAVS